MTNQQFRALIYVLLQATTAICSAIYRQKSSLDSSLENLVETYDKLEG